MKGMPNNSEQETVRQYCFCRELVRPKTNILKAIFWLLLFEMINVALFYCISLLCALFGISLSSSLIYLITSILVLSISIKKICILLIELYQHYASERIRRRCTLMPSCSEYTKLALYKYGIILGLYKSYIRLFKKCGVNLYQIDYP